MCIHEVGQLQDPSTESLVEPLVQHPQLIGMLCRQPVGRAGGAAEMPTL